MERQYNAEEVKAWKSCMDKWAEEFGGKERKKVGSICVFHLPLLLLVIPLFGRRLWFGMMKLELTNNFNGRKTIG